MGERRPFGSEDGEEAHEGGEEARISETRRAGKQEERGGRCSGDKS